MSLVTYGLGIGRGLLTHGLGCRVAQTAHPQWFNTPVTNPDMYARDRIGTDGDPEYAVWTPEPDCVYNARAVEIFLPEGVELPPASVERIRAHLEIMRPKTCTIRVTEVRGPERLLIPSSGDPS